jgi:tetratricopeptide (TPR) repeat protein
MKRMPRYIAGMLIGVLTATTGFSRPQEGEPSVSSRTAEAYYLFARGHMLEDDGEWDAALESYEEALALDPTNSSIYSEIAASYAGRGIWRDAVDYANRAISADPDNLEAHRLLGSIYTSLLSNNGGQDGSEEFVGLAIEELEHVVRLSPEETETYLMLGRLYRFSGQPERAVEVYRDFMQVESSSEEGVIALAELQMEAGNVGEAIELLEGFSANQPESDSALIILGQAYVQMDELDDAADVFQKVIDLGRDEVEIRQELARVLFVSRRWDDAAVKYEELVELRPEDPEPWLRLGQIERQRLNYAEARGYLGRADQMLPGSIDIGFNLALLNRDVGQFDDAIDRLRGLLDTMERRNGRYTGGERDNHRLFLTHIALLHTMGEEYEEAVSAFEEIKEFVRERDGTIDSYIVDTYRSAREPERALEKAESSLRVFPDHFGLQLQHADLLGETGSVEEGLALLEDILEDTEQENELEDPDWEYRVFSAMVGIHEGAEDWAAAEELLSQMLEEFEDLQGQSYFLRGALLERQQHDNEAEEAFREALDIDADNPAVLNYLGYMLADNGDKLEEALEMIQRAVDSDPINGAYLDSLGWAYYRLNRLELAEEYLKRAVLFASTDPTLHEHLGDLYSQSGRPDEALQAYERSLELADDQEEREAVQEKLEQLRSEI